MNPALITLIIQGIEAAISNAPQIAAVVVKAKEFITSLVAGGLITAEQENALHAHVDAVEAMAKTGVIPSHWQVQPDPAS